MSDHLENIPKKYPCPICGEPKKIGISKKDKPYYFCDLCGVQVFIRGKAGIRKLSELKLSGALDEFESDGPPLDTLKVIQLENEISFIKSKIEELNEKNWDLSLSPKEESILGELDKQLKRVEDQRLTKLANLKK